MISLEHKKGPKRHHVLRTMGGRETSGGVAKCRLFSQARFKKVR